MLIGNPFDIFELRHAEAKLELLEGRPHEARELVKTLIADPALRSAVATNGRAEELLADIELDLGEKDLARSAFIRAASLYGIQEQFRQASLCWQRAVDLETLRVHNMDTVAEVS